MMSSRQSTPDSVPLGNRRSRARIAAVSVISVGLAAPAVVLDHPRGIGDAAGLSALAVLGAWALTRHVLALLERRRGGPRVYVSSMVVGSAAIGGFAFVRYTSDLVVPLMFALFGRVFAEIARGAFSGEGIYAEAEKEKAEELTEFEELSTPVRLPDWNGRLIARGLDTVVIVSAGFGIGTATGLDTLASALILWPLYEIPLIAWRGSTLGKAIAGLGVLDSRGAKRVPLSRAALRFGLLVANVPFIILQTRITGDLLWALDPRLSVMKPTYCGTVLALRSEKSRLFALSGSERRRQLDETVREIRALPAPVSRKAALVIIAAFAVIILLITLFTH